MRTNAKVILVATALAAWALLSGCSAPSPETAPAELSVGPVQVLVLNDGWAKSAESGGMTGVFGLLENQSETDIELLSAESESAGLIEFHEVTEASVMQEIQGPVIVPAGDAFELAPGADHLMLMMLHNDLLPGDEVSFTLRFVANGSEFEQLFTVAVKDFGGANEDYGDLQHDHASGDQAPAEKDPEHGSH
jgi:copper(I)-binding protein